VRYTLELSTSQDFAVQTLSKTDLQIARYTPQAGEALEDRTTYYWRVKAEDSLSNASPFTPAAKFYIQIQSDLALDADVKNQGRQPFGRAVAPSEAIVAWFDREMAPASLLTGISLFQKRNRLGHTIHNKVPGSVELSSANRMARFVPSSPLSKGSLYRVVIASSVMDAQGFLAGKEITWEFRTVADRNIQTTLEPYAGMKVTLHPGAFSQDAGVKVIRDPLNSAEQTDKTLIRRALEAARQKGIRNGQPEHRYIPGMMIEIYGETSNGSIIRGALGNSVTLTLSYDDADNDGHVDGTHPQVPVSDLEFYRLEENLGEFVKLQGTGVDTVNKSVSVDVDHFSVFAVMSGAAKGISKVLIRPNPWNTFEDPEPVIIDNLPDPAEIDVYRVTGQKVATLRVRDGSGLYRWDGRSQDGVPLASGVYLLNIKSLQGSRVEKLTIIR